MQGWGHTDPHPHPTLCPHRDSMDSVKQSAALCLLRLYKASPDLVPMGEWTARVVHLLNDQHMVRPLPPRPSPPWARPECLRPPASVPDTHLATQGSCPVSPTSITHPTPQKKIQPLFLTPRVSPTSQRLPSQRRDSDLCPLPDAPVPRGP